MLAIFPSLQAEELVYSAVSRYADMMAFPDTEDALRQIFRFNPGDPDVELPDALQRFLLALPPGHGLTLRSLTDRHTAFPYYRPFLPEPRARAVETAIRSGSARGSSPYARAEFSTSLKWAAPQPQFLHYCKRCVDDDRRSPAGFAYWRRVHQLAGVVVCPTHHVPLTSTYVPRDPREYRYRWSEAAPQWVSLERAVSLPSSDLVVPPEAAAMARCVAEDSQWLLHQQLPTSSARTLFQRHRAWLAHRGLVRPDGRLDSARFDAAVREFYPNPVFDALGCTPLMTGGGRLGFNWLQGIWKLPYPALPPLTHILLFRFSGLSAFQFFTQDPPPLPSTKRATLAGPCGNPVCPKYDPPVPRVVPRRRAGGAAYATVVCPECGFAYGQRVGAPGGRRAILRVGPVWENRLRELVGEENAKVRDVARALGVRPARVKRHALELGCWPAAWGPVPKPRGPGKRALARTRRISEYRRQVRRLHKNEPELTRSRLESQLPQAVRYLSRVDQAWLDREVPPGPPRERPRRQPHYFMHPSPDECALRACRDLVALIRAWPGRPVQIRPRIVLRLVGGWVFDAYDHIPGRAPSSAKPPSRLMPSPSGGSCGLPAGVRPTGMCRTSSSWRTERCSPRAGGRLIGQAWSAPSAHSRLTREAGSRRPRNGRLRCRSCS